MVAATPTLGRICCGNHAQVRTLAGGCGAEVGSGTPVPLARPDGLRVSPGTEEHPNGTSTHHGLGPWGRQGYSGAWDSGRRS